MQRGLILHRAVEDRLDGLDGGFELQLFELGDERSAHPTSHPDLVSEPHAEAPPMSQGEQRAPLRAIGWDHPRRVKHESVLPCERQHVADAIVKARLRGGNVAIDRSTLGPVEILAVAFPGNQFKGEIVPALRELVDDGVIRILDLTFVKKELDGTVTALEVGELEGDRGRFLRLARPRRGRVHQRRGPGRRCRRVGGGQLGRPARVGGPVGGQACGGDPRRQGRGPRARARAERSSRRGARRARRGLTPVPTRRKEARMPRFGRPGLLGTMARTAVVAGTATAVSGRVARRQQQRYMESEQADAYQQEQYAAQQAPAAAPPATAARGRPHDRAAAPRRSQDPGPLVRRGVRRRQAEAAGRLARRERALRLHAGAKSRITWNG